MLSDNVMKTWLVYHIVWLLDKFFTLYMASIDKVIPAHDLLQCMKLMYPIELQVSIKIPHVSEKMQSE